MPSESLGRFLLPDFTAIAIEGVDPSLLRKLEMPASQALAYEALLPGRAIVARTPPSTRPLGAQRAPRNTASHEDGEENAELVLPVWLANVVWELRQALLFPAPLPRGPLASPGAPLPPPGAKLPVDVGVRLHRKDGPRILASIVAHTPEPVLEAAWRLGGPSAIGPLVDDALLAVEPRVRVPPRLRTQGDRDKGRHLGERPLAFPAPRVPR